MKAKSKSYVTSAKTMYAALTILSKNGGTMPIRTLMQEIEKTVELSSWEKEILQNTVVTKSIKYSPLRAQSLISIQGGKN